MEFEGRVALITGGAGGIGSATADNLKRQGASLVILDHNEEALEQSRGRHPQALHVKADVTDFTAVEACITASQERFGRLDILVNVAGGGLPRTINSMTPDEWQRTIGLNLTGPFNMIKGAAPLMRASGGGSIVTVASLAALGISLNSGVSYTAAKSGLLGLTRHAAYELASYNIRVNAVLPGAIMTPQMREKISPEAYESIPKRSPIGRWINPSEVASTIAFFCSSASSACTGTHLLVDGGWLIGGPEDRDAYFRQRKDEAPERVYFKDTVGVAGRADK
jgi:3-oxoacyl-[acyl-carrier protein] reductase